MNLLLLLASYPIIIISNQKRNDYINAITYVQSNRDDISQLVKLVLEATKNSFIETLRLIVTASDSRGRGKSFYEEMIEFLDM